MSFSSKLKESRLAIGLTQQQVAEIMGITKTAYCGYENGRREPDVEKIKQLARILRISGDELLEISYRDDNYVSPDELNSIKKYRALDAHGKKIVSLVLDEEYNRCCAAMSEVSLSVRIIPFSLLPASAGTGEWLDEENMDEIEIPNNRNTRDADYAVKVSGDSMEPTYHDGDIVLVQKQDEISIGDIGIFIVDGRGYIKERGKDCLISHNPAYDDIHPAEDVYFRCCGKVVGKL